MKIKFQSCFPRLSTFLHGYTASTDNATQSALQFLNDHVSERAEEIYTDTVKMFPDKAKDYMISPGQGRFINWLVEMSNSERILELGSFTGYSAACMLSGYAGVDCRKDVTCVEKIKEYATMLKANVPEANVVNVDALDYLLSFTSDQEQQFDFVFVDAGKKRYDAIHDLLIKKEIVMKGGMIVYDNVFLRDRVFEDVTLYNEGKQRGMAEKMRAFLENVLKDRRAVLVPAFDGILIFNV